jgi:hypothetical protein
MAQAASASVRALVGIRFRRAERLQRLRRTQRTRRRRLRQRLYLEHLRFDAEVRRRHAQLKQSLAALVRESGIVNLCTLPIIYSLAVPLALVDLWVTLYQWVCFPIYGVARVRRRSYMVIDRHRLGYLNAIERANCLYCSYANGVIAYVREVAGRTEQYWCPIKHARRTRAPHTHYQGFVEYGDAEGYRRELPALRRALERPASRPRVIEPKASVHAGD